MIAATGILTARGGSTSTPRSSRAALGLPCVAGVAALDIDLAQRQMHVGDKIVREGDSISIDGTTGEVFLGELPHDPAQLPREKELIELLTVGGRASHARRVGERGYARGVPSRARARREGVGLARTEHMFRQAERLPIVQDMIMADEVEVGRRRSRSSSLPAGRLLRDVQGDGRLSVVIRLIDPPLHEFLREYATSTSIIAVDARDRKDGAELERKEKIERRLQQLHEDNRCSASRLPPAARVSRDPRDADPRHPRRRRSTRPRRGSRRSPRS
jgi:pyruvate,orthophosphate dikinase